MTHSNVLSHLRTPRFAPMALVTLMLTISGCQSDVTSRDDADPVSTNPVSTAPANTAVPVVPSESNEDGSNGSTVSNGQFRIDLSASQFSLVEGTTTANVNISIVRENGHNSPINLALQGSDFAAEADMRWQFTDTVIDTSENASNLQIQLGIARGPIQPQQRAFNLVASDGNSSSSSTTITLNITPTPQPDVYLLIGQSNMVGASLFDARESGPGEADEPNPRILQLNVTGNDSTNFPTPASFTNRANLADSNSPTVQALDPLHDGFNFNINSKTNTRIGLGLTFAREMLPSTTANIMLVPAAWSDTGFCQTDTIHLPGMGWHATAPSDTTNFAGTLLHDRALARLNLVLETTNGIFRGILWHQGEADTNEDVCAAAYEENLRNLVASIRSNARVDMRGPQARGAAADVPFIAGTLSRGTGFTFDDITPAGTMVDNAHRTIPSIIPFAATVINDDLVPPTYPCGDGGCIHFGATAYREMGTRYAERMRAVQQR